MGKLVHGVGVNDADYVLSKFEITGYINGKHKRKLVWICPFYRTWASMLKRCFCEKYKAERPTYEDVTCCKEWYLFSDFKSWMEQQDYKGKQLDKDIIFTNNKVYNPETCAFVSGVTNGFITARDASRGDCLLGVHWDKGSRKFKAQCKNPFTKKRGTSGLFQLP